MRTKTIGLDTNGHPFFGDIDNLPHDAFVFAVSNYGGMHAHGHHQGMGYTGTADRGTEGKPCPKSPAPAELRISMGDDAGNGKCPSEDEADLFWEEAYASDYPNEAND